MVIELDSWNEGRIFLHVSNEDTTRPGSTMHRIASIDDIRAHFPALSRRHNGFPVAYFDGPGGTQAPLSVGKAMTDYLYYHNANTHWAYPSSVETDEMLASARQTFAHFLNASADEIAFGANMTTLTLHISRALGASMGPEDEIVVTELDHHANIDPWRRLANERGIQIRLVRMNPSTGQLDWSHLEECINERTRLVAIGAASNALGTINDIPRAAELAHHAGAYLFVDAVHYAPHHLVDVAAMDCDFLVCSAYKFYGPHVGILFGRHHLLEQLDVPKLIPAPNEHAERLETGTQNHEGIMGAAAAVDFFADLHPDPTLDRRLRLKLVFKELDRRGMEQVARLWKGLESFEGLKLYGPPPDKLRTTTVSFTMAGVSSEDVTRRLADQGVFASHGDFYATTVIERLGLTDDGLVRIGCACYTTDRDIDRVIEGVERMQAA